MALSKLESLSSRRIKDFMDEKAEEDALSLSEGLSAYQAVAKERDLLSCTVWSGARAGEVVPARHRVISSLKGWIRGPHGHGRRE